ncbi:MAG: chaperonin [Flavobacterium sp.]|uniref:head GIN domain-containing protein n=1 Tax=Flavobacterium sp. TaxID=239 RepID=UPI000C527958|nr:head GIN domain-containing protein [Flavobacterium sp.]MBF02722.1 chaperonin [Flavobacterium sp.]|tara:strand:+ start:1071 stop:1736 length:666 start_codon:yes stop_codon:yes gene_type:complete
MKKLIYSLLFITALGFSQTEKQVDAFSKVTAFDKIDVYLIKSTENKVVLKGDKKEDVEIVNKNGELKIRMSFGKLLQGDNISATVYYTSIDAIEANEGSRVSSNDTFDGVLFELIAKEGSEIKVHFEVEKLKARASQGSILKLSGNADYADILVNSGAQYEAKELITKQTTITGNAGGQADVYATDLVDAKIRAGGTILIHGKPKQINQKTIAGGTIEQAK